MHQEKRFRPDDEVLAATEGIFEGKGVELITSNFKENSKFELKIVFPYFKP